MGKGMFLSNTRLELSAYKTADSGHQWVWAEHIPDHKDFRWQQWCDPQFCTLNDSVVVRWQKLTIHQLWTPTVHIHLQ